MGNRRLEMPRLTSSSSVSPWVRSIEMNSRSAAGLCPTINGFTGLRKRGATMRLLSFDTRGALRLIWLGIVIQIVGELWDIRWHSANPDAMETGTAVPVSIASGLAECQ